MTARPLDGIRVIESSLLEPASLGAMLADLGADVIKVEPPGEGDYVRRMAWPIIEGVSILHWHCNRGKRSLSLDLRKDEAVALYLDLVTGADVVLFPAPSRARAVSVCDPFGTDAVFHLNQNGTMLRVGFAGHEWDGPMH